MIETRSISLSVEYKKTAYSTAANATANAASGTVQGVASSGAAAGATVTLNAAPLYVSSTATNKAATS